MGREGNWGRGEHRLAFGLSSAQAATSPRKRRELHRIASVGYRKVGAPALRWRRPITPSSGLRVLATPPGRPSAQAVIVSCFPGLGATAEPLSPRARPAPFPWLKSPCVPRCRSAPQGLPPPGWLPSGSLLRSQGAWLRRSRPSVAPFSPRCTQLSGAARLPGCCRGALLRAARSGAEGRGVGSNSSKVVNPRSAARHG